ncbi:MAG: ABC transporter ATP-binding protein [Proteobacteria bacterium]|nr:MAG: ABC transporter ATP-binding protein [Pseudomonadota bacterium]
MPGSTVALVGESGSGKSVTAQAILGILPNIARVSAGTIMVNTDEYRDVDVAALDPNSARMRSIRGGVISMIFQEPMVSLSPLHTIGDQVSEALFLHRDASREEGIRLTREMLGLVGFPNPERALNTYPFELSGGLRQRAMIALALICRPALLIADEPTTALDVTIQAQILHLVRELQNELGMAVLLITHDLGVVANIAEEVVVMYHGEIMERGSAADIYRSPKHPYLKALFKAVPHFDMKKGERLVPVREIEYDIGDHFKAKPEKAVEEKRHLQLTGIVKSFSIRSEGWFGSNAARFTAVDDVSITIGKGECMGLVGESGCGKTTLSKIAMRALTPDSGSVTFFDDGREIDVLSLDDKALFDFRRKMQIIFQDPFSSLNPRMTVYDIVREPLVIHRIGDEAYQVELVKELMRLVGLDPRFLSRYPHSFSGGQRQRIGIARALALRPDVIICDEPVSALDVSIQAQILNLLKDLQSELHLTYLFVSHNLAVVDYISDRICVMCKGKLVEVAPREQIFENPVHPYTKALLSAVPFPELERKLDFEFVYKNRASDPESWPEPFSGDPERGSAMVDIGDEHFVRARPDTTPGELTT